MLFFKIFSRKICDYRDIYGGQKPFYGNRCANRAQRAKDCVAARIKPYLQYQIGMMYFKGLGTPINNQKAAEYLEKSAELENQYAQNILDNQEKFENEMLVDTVFRLFVNLSRCIEDVLQVWLYFFS